MIFTSFYRRRIREQFAGETAHLNICSIIIIMLIIKFIYFIYVLLFYILTVRKETTFA
jgi:hypothetical protein